MGFLQGLVQVVQICQYLCFRKSRSSGLGVQEQGEAYGQDQKS
jgi:hypothetical protein